jgi:hypothetical protein
MDVVRWLTMINHDGDYPARLSVLAWCFLAASTRSVSPVALPARISGGGTDEVSEAVSPIPAGVFPLSLFVLQSDGLGEPQPKNLLGFIDAAQLKISERL